MYDDENADLLKSWNHTFDFIQKAKDAGSKVLVHCKMGEFVAREYLSTTVLSISGCLESDLSSNCPRFYSLCPLYQSWVIAHSDNRCPRQFVSFLTSVLANLSR